MGGEGGKMQEVVAIMNYDNPEKTRLMQNILLVISNLYYNRDLGVKDFLCLELTNPAHKLSNAHVKCTRHNKNQERKAAYFVLCRCLLFALRQKEIEDVCALAMCCMMCEEKRIFLE